MARVADEVGAKFYLLDAPASLGLTDASFKTDPIHLQPKEAVLQTDRLAEILKEGAGC